MATTHVDASRPRTRPMATQKKSTKTTTSQVSAINGNSSIKVARSDSSKDVSTLAQVMGILAMMASVVMPTLASWGMTTGLIFGGCCSNVFTLEIIVRENPKSGLLITFVQFLVTALLTWPTHFSASHPPFFLKPRAIPLARWLPNIILFFSVNLLNNFAFSYNLSIPVHIILRSGGSVTTMFVGFVWGKRYSRAQVFSVAMLTSGIIIAAMADAKSKGKNFNGDARIKAEFITGFLILALAQLLSAIMGLYTQLTYDNYGSHWHENLFYSHFLSIPLFFPFLPSLLQEFRQLLISPSINLVPSFLSPKSTLEPQAFNPILVSPSLTFPRQILNLFLNAITQYACIRGVNLLSARTTALGVSIMLNVRKLVSLFASIWLFGNHLPPGVLFGATVVFGSAGVWAAEGQRLKKTLEEGTIKAE